MISYDTIIKCKTKQCGKAICAILPKRFVKENNIKPHEEITIELKGKVGNVLKKMYGSMKFSKPTEQLLKEVRRDLESKY
mgnify:CR=1 FL=1